MKFEITEKQETMIAMFWKGHDCDFQKEMGMEAATTYCFTQTGIGVSVKVQCSCGATLDITDYESW
jgi:succinate dehydrogenase/fumarate reductase flavoprotein subunit